MFCHQAVNASEQVEFLKECVVMDQTKTKFPTCGGLERHQARQRARQNVPVHESLIKLRPDHAGPNVHHPDSPKRHQGNPAQIGNGSQILGNGLELVDLMRKSGWLCSHCSPGAPNKALTGGSAGGGDPRRDQRE